MKYLMNSPDPAKIKVLIIDDHTLFNDGLASILASEELIDVKGQVYHSRLAFEAVQRIRPDLVLMDFNMPGLNGLELSRLLLKSFPDLKLLILSMYGDIRFVEDFRKAKVHGYMLKTADIIELVHAMQTIVNGGNYFDSKIVLSHSAANHTDDDFLKKNKLTRKEFEILGFIKAGYKSTQIAELMSLSRYTVETHRKNIHFKLQTKGSAEIFKWLSKNDF